MVNCFLPYYLTRFFGSLFICLPGIVLYLLATGYSYTNIMLGFGIQAATHTIFEIPSGVCSDRLGRRRTMLIAALTQTIGAVLLLSLESCWNLFLAFFCFGLAGAFFSGTTSAFIYDLLLQQKAVQKYAQAESWSQALSLLGIASGALLGGFLLADRFYLALLFTVGAFFLAFFCLLLLPETTVSTATKPNTGWQHLCQALQVVRADPPLLHILLVSAAIYGFLEIGFFFFQPWLQTEAVPLQAFGLIYFSWLLTSAGGAKIAPWLSKHWGANRAVFGLTLLAGLTFLHLAWGVKSGLFAVYLIELAYGALLPLAMVLANPRITSSHRATVLSLPGLL